MNCTIEEKNIVEIYNKAYDLCLKCKFQESYELIQDIAKKYEIPFFAILCLNLERYGYYKHLDKNNLKKIDYTNVVLIDDEFKEICEKAKRACDVAYDFYNDMILKGIFCEKDPNATVDLYRLQENIFAANHFASEAASTNSDLASRAAWGLSRKYIIKALMIFSEDSSVWNSFAKTFLEQELDEEYMQGYIAIKRAQEIDEEYLKDNSEPWDIPNFDIHYTLLQYLVFLKQFGLEQPLIIRKELRILETYKRTPEQEYKIKELKSEIVIAEHNSKFSYEEILNADHNTPNTFSTYNNKSQTQNLNNQNDGCYVATAVYGSYDCPSVWTLRRYRDNILAKTMYGRAFIRIYYAISPTLVKWYGHTKWFKKMWQGKLDRMVAKLQANGVESTPYKDRKW